MGLSSIETSLMYEPSSTSSWKWNLCTALHSPRASWVEDKESSVCSDCCLKASLKSESDCRNREKVTAETGRK